MGKKIKIGTIKVKRTVTVRHQISAQQHISSHTELEPMISSSSSTRSVIPQGETERISSVNNVRTSKQHSLPSGVYSPQVENVYEELYKRTKPEEMEQNLLYDVFISHASEDKRDFVNPLVEKLQEAGISVWYDSLEMQWGKSLRQQIDNGIKRSKYAILVLSKNFFNKKWPQRELDGILAKEEITGANPLPIWYDISYQEVYDFSPTLTGLYSLSTDKNSIDDICKALQLILGKEKIEENKEDI